MEDLTIDGNPGWIDTDAADANVIVSAISHGGSVASITLDVVHHDGSPAVEVGVELTRADVSALIEQLTLIAAHAAS